MKDSFESQRKKCLVRETPLNDSLRNNLIAVGFSKVFESSESFDKHLKMKADPIIFQNDVSA